MLKLYVLLGLPGFRQPPLRCFEEAQDQQTNRTERWNTECMRLLLCETVEWNSFIHALLFSILSNVVGCL